jgi:hypothetical protein
MISRIPYEGATDSECGRQYRPGQVPPENNYCHLVRGHESRRHSTRRSATDDAGFEWMDEEEAELTWPAQQEEEN